MLVSVPDDNHDVGLAGTAAGRHAETLEIVARHGSLHHLNRTAGKTEGHPHERARARPVNEIIGGGDEKPLVGKLGIHRGEIFPPDAGQVRSPGIVDQSHSSAPFRHS